MALDPFFTHILMHELMHGLGPQTIKINGGATHRPPGAQGGEWHA